MNPLVASPIAHALGWTLLHFCWQGAAVALLLWFVLGALGTRSSRLRYAASCTALVLMVTLPLGTFIRLAIDDSGLATLARTPVQVIDVFVSTGSSTAASPWTARLSIALEHSLPWLIAVWCVGVTCFLTRLGLGLVAARALRATGDAVSAELRVIFDELRVRLGISRAVELLHSARVEVPTVIGWLRPVVLLPASCLSGLAPDQIEAILCHELAHIRRHDYLVSVLQSVVETLLFYHPAVWWVSRQVRRERECCCDEFAVRAGGDALAYARTLALLEEQRSPTPQLALGANGGVLKMRIQRLLGRPEGSGASQFTSIAVLVVLAVSTLTVAGRIAWAETHPAQAAATPAQVQVPAQPPSPSIPAASASSDRTASHESSTATSSDPEAAAPPTQNEPVQTKVMLDETQDFLTQQLDAVKGRLERQDAAYFALAARLQNKKQLSEDDLRRLEGSRQTLKESQDQFNEIRAQLRQAQMAVAVEERTQAVEAANLKINMSEMEKQLAAAHAALAQESTPPPPPPPPAIVVDVPNPSFHPLRVSAGVMQQLDLTQPPPVYPEIAKAAHLQGVVVLHAVISKEGKVEQLSVVSGPPMLQQSAIDAVQQWTYRPFLLDGQPVEVESTINVNYTFGGKGAESSGIGAGSGPELPITLPDGETVRNIGGVVTPPAVIRQVAPTFSEEARKAKFGGTVLVGLIVDSQGIPEHVHIIRGVGMGLDENAVEAVKQYHFRPAMEDGKPVPVALNVQVNFKISDGPKPAPPPPDMSCTYYDKKDQGHDGTCEEGSADKGNYYCRANDNKGNVEAQIGCESKVKQMQDWQHDNLSPTNIQTPAP